MITHLDQRDVSVLFMPHRRDRQGPLDWLVTRIRSPCFGHVALAFTPDGSPERYVFDWTRQRGGIGMTRHAVYMRYWPPWAEYVLGAWTLRSRDLSKQPFRFCRFNCAAFVSEALGLDPIQRTPDTLYEAVNGRKTWHARTYTNSNAAR